MVYLVCGVNMNCTEIPRPPGVIASVIGDNRAKRMLLLAMGLRGALTVRSAQTIAVCSYGTACAGHPSDCPARARSILIDKVLLKAVRKTGEKKAKVFTMRSIDTEKIVSRDALKTAIRGQLR